MFDYPIYVTFDAPTGAYEISFRDFKNLHSVAYSVDTVESEAIDGLTAAIYDRINDRIPIPEASFAQEGEIVIHLPALICLKAALHNSMIQTGTRKADLARKLNQKAPQIDRLLDVGHASKVEALERALLLLGREISITVHETRNHQ